MTEIKQISALDDIQEVIKSAFDVELDVAGGWGYSVEDAIIIDKNSENKKQIEHTLCSMRSHLELSLTREQSQRYGGINVNELSREMLNIHDKKYDKVTYRIDAMLESNYSKFINEYKQGYGKEEFDLEKHFSERKNATEHMSVEIFYLLS